MSQPTSAKQAMVNHVLDLMREFGPVSARAMFGGHGIYREGLMFALMADDKLYFKADEQSIPEFTGLGLQPFTFEFKGKVGHLKYYEAPLDAYEEPRQMAHWARMGYECALRQRKAPKLAR
jgi:DNA transformation protein